MQEAELYQQATEHAAQFPSPQQETELINYLKAEEVSEYQAFMVYCRWVDNNKGYS